MKCVKNSKTGKITRIEDERATGVVEKLDFTYCPKHEWKKQEGKRYIENGIVHNA